jgi:cytochrome c oxidase cbb3-type subunit 3
MSVQPARLTDHEYDGIQEYDNPTPGWWWWIFFLTTVFSVAYWLVYHVGTVGGTMHDAHQGAVAADLRLQFAEIGELKPDQETLLRFMHDEKWLQVGVAVFKGRCISCHGSDAAGQIGPNLTDDHYKNVRKLEDIPFVVMDGANNGAMPAWKNQLHPNEVVLVSAYIASLRGKNLPSPRPAEGELIAPWPTDSE